MGMALSVKNMSIEEKIQRKINMMEIKILPPASYDLIDGYPRAISVFLLQF
jgi:hypothetical protein